jgi:hypothetical protein
MVSFTKAAAVLLWTTATTLSSTTKVAAFTRSSVSPHRAFRCFSPYSTTSLANAPRHDVGGAAQQDLPEEVQKAMMAYQEHQQTAPKLDWATDVRTLVQYNHGFAVMSTNSKADEGYPGGSVVGFAPDEDGRPLFIFSGMSAHTQDILADPRCSLTVAAKDFKVSTHWSNRALYTHRNTI